MGGGYEVVDNHIIKFNIGNSPNATISFSYSLNGILVSEILCIEKLVKPTANFTINTVEGGEFESCLEEALNFNSTSFSNGGSEIVNYLWDFGNGDFSNEQNPVYTYPNDGSYQATLTITNACGCQSQSIVTINVNKLISYSIECATVVCEDAVEVYTVSFDAMSQCESFDWEVTGGTINASAGGNVEVQWNNPDASGFGYLTFLPNHCEVECSKPSTIKIPIIQHNATIVGSNSICTQKSAIYSLPKWPSTAITWSIINNTTDDPNIQTILTDQRNEVALLTTATNGNFTLRAVYENTILGCGGEAFINIFVKPTINLYTDNNKICVGGENPLIVFNSLNENLFFEVRNATDESLVLTSDISNGLEYFGTEPGQFYATISSDIYCEKPRLYFEVLPKPIDPEGIEGDVEVCPQIVYSYNVINPDDNLYYEWSVFGGQIIGSSIGNQVNIIFDTLPAQVDVIAKNPVLNCASDSTSTIIEAIQLDGNIRPTIEVNPQNLVSCSSVINEYSLFENGTENLHQNADTYEWSVSNPLIGSISQGQNTNSVQITWNQVVVDTYVDIQVKLIRCSLPSVTITRTILIKAIPQINFTNFDEVIYLCGNIPYTLSVVSSDNSINLDDQDVEIEYQFNGQTVIGGTAFTFEFVNTGDENIYKNFSAKIISYNGCNGQSNTIDKIFVVMPNVVPNITTNNTVVYCQNEPINNLLVCSYLLPYENNFFPASYQWQLDGVAIAGATNSTYQANQIGNYTCVTSNPFSGCLATSNVINIINKICTDDGDDNSLPCNSGLFVTNDSFYSSCGEITLAATTNGTNLQYTIFPNNVGIINGNTFTAPPGLYTISVKANLPCEAQGVDAKYDYIQVLIPFEPLITAERDCTNEVQLVLKSSSFYPLLENPLETISYIDPFNGNPVTISSNEPFYDLLNTVFFPENFQWPFVITVTNSGTYEGVNYVCQKDFLFEDLNVPDLTIKTNVLPFQLCHNSPVTFSFEEEDQINPNDYSFLWTFEDGVTNTLSNPTRVFSEPGTYMVSVEVSNNTCLKTFYFEIIIPEPCFEGMLITEPANATVCDGQPITISYVSDSFECDIEYLWMLNDSALNLNQNTIQVYEPGYYWLKVRKPGTNCVYEVPNRIYPIIETIPYGKIISEEVYCENEPINIKAIAQTGISYDLYIENPYIPIGNEAIALAAGTYNINMDIYGANCTTTITKQITIIAPPIINDIDIKNLKCAPYTIQLTVAAENATHFVWSTGQSGQSINANHGGIYQVTAFAGNCSVTQTINVPKHPSEYAWSYPSGCFNTCDSDELNVLGPIIALDQIVWQNQDVGTIAIHNNEASPVSPIPVRGAYNAFIDYFGCQFETRNFNFNTQDCDTCKIEVDKTRLEITLNEQLDYCSLTMNLNLVNTSLYNINIIIEDLENNVIVTPSAITLLPGLNQVTLQIIPLNLNSNSMSLSIIGSLYDEELNKLKCTYYFDSMELPECNLNKNSSAKNNFIEGIIPFQIKCYPNPVSNELQVSCTQSGIFDTFKIFDLQGKLLLTETLNYNENHIIINTNALEEGMYIAAFFNKELIVAQQKIIKK